MIDYWLNLDPAERTFTGIAIFSSLILTIQMAMVMLGGAVDMPEAEIAETGEGGASGIFSIRTIGAFFAGFGWAGAAMLQAGHSTGAATFVATLSGSAFLGVVIYLMSYLHSLRQEGTLNYSNAIGNVGNVYLPIPPKRKGMGQVEVMVQGRLRIVQALSDSDKKIGNRVAVRVTDTIDEQTILVRALEDEVSSEKESTKTDKPN
ncbi:MAG: hypothetical protein P8P49_03015 [Opitutales bacterium]|nr:hypothetical protein [Opitutales bacterium]MDG1324712.1 hypothetical protein [Opitutales bacterium]